MTKNTRKPTLKAFIAGHDPLKVERLGFSDGLIFEMRKHHPARWLFRYTRPKLGKQNEIAIGPYESFTLAEAKASANDLRALVARGIDPSVRRVELAEAARIASRPTKTFANYLSEFFASQEWSESHRETWEGIWRNHIERKRSQGKVIENIG